MAASNPDNFDAGLKWNVFAFVWEEHKKLYTYFLGYNYQNQ